MKPPGQLETERVTYWTGRGPKPPWQGTRLPINFKMRPL